MPRGKNRKSKKESHASKKVVKIEPKLNTKKPNQISNNREIRQAMEKAYEDHDADQEEEKVHKDKRKTVDSSNTNADLRPDFNCKKEDSNLSTEQNMNLMSSWHQEDTDFDKFSKLIKSLEEQRQKRNNQYSNFNAYSQDQIERQLIELSMHEKLAYFAKEQIEELKKTVKETMYENHDLQSKLEESSKKIEELENINTLKSKCVDWNISDITKYKKLHNDFVDEVKNNFKSKLTGIQMKHPYILKSGHNADETEIDKIIENKENDLFYEHAKIPNFALSNIMKAVKKLEQATAQIEDSDQHASNIMGLQTDGHNCQEKQDLNGQVYLSELLECEHDTKDPKLFQESQSLEIKSENRQSDDHKVGQHFSDIGNHSDCQKTQKTQIMHENKMGMETDKMSQRTSHIKHA